jgi:pyrroloquinoline quinone biosynthesis protein D
MIVKLARGVRLRRDDIRGQTVLLAPELAMALDEIAIKIVEALDGKRISIP